MTAKKFTTEEIATELSEAARLKFTDGGCDCKRCEVDRQNRQNLVAIVEQFQAEAVSEESAHLATIDDRAHYEEAISETARALGCEDEWSNVHDHAKCVVELAEEAAAELRTLKEQRAKVLFRVEDWYREHGDSVLSVTFVRDKITGWLGEDPMKFYGEKRDA